MKQKLSITVEKRLISKIEAKLKQGLFRNKSHVIEYAIKQFLEHKKSTGQMTDEAGEFSDMLENQRKNDYDTEVCRRCS